MDVEIKIGNLRFVARLEEEAAPKSCHAFQAMLPLETQLIQARWSGEAAWIPMGERERGLGIQAASPPQRAWTSCVSSGRDRTSTRLNSSHANISNGVFCS